MSLEVVHCFGFDPETGMEYADTSVLVALCGNGFHFSSVERDSRSQFLWGAGTSISCYATNRRARLLGYAEKGLSPRIFIHDLLTHELLCTLNGAAQLSVCSLAFSRDGKKLVVSTRVPDQQLTVWDWPKRQILSTLELNFDAELLSFSPLTSDVICAMGSGKVQLVGVVKTPHETSYIRRDAAAPLPVVPMCHCWTANGNLLLGCENGSLVYYDVEQLSVVPCPSTEAITWLNLDVPIRAIEPTIDMLAIACGDGYVRFLSHPDLEAGEPSRMLLELRLTPDEEPAELLSIRWSTDFSEMIAVASDANVYRMQVSTSGTAQTFQVEVTATLWASCHTGAVTGTGALPGGTRFASTGEDGSLRIWDIERTELLERLLMGSQQTALATHKHTGFIAIGSEYGVLRIFFAEDEAEPPQLVFRKRLHREPIRIVEFSPSGAQLLSIADDGRICFISMSPSPRVLGYLDVSTLRNPEFPEPSSRLSTSRGIGGRSSTMSIRPGSREGREPRQSVFTRTLSRALSVLKPKRVEDTPVQVGSVVWAPTAEFYNSGADGQAGVDLKIDGEIILSVCEVGGPPSLMIVNSVSPDMPSQPDMYINQTEVEVLLIPIDIPLIAMTAVHDAPSPNLTGAGRKSGAAGRSSVAGQRTSAASAATHGGGGARTSVRTGSPATGSRGSLTSGGMRTSESLALLFSETMTLLALGADKTLRKYTLTNKWYRDRLSTGQPLPMLEADSAMDVTDKVGGALRISPSGKSLLLALEDGTLQLRTFDGKAMSIAPHDTLRGGACCVTLELSGGYAVSSGLDGMSFLLYSKEFEAAAAAPTPPPLPFDMNTVNEQYDEDDEKTVLEETIEPAEVADDMDMTIRNNTTKELERLRERHALLLARNAAAPDMEKLPPHELVVDHRLRDVLAAEADAAASLLKSRAFTDNLKRDVISSRIRNECWDSMAARGVMVTGATCTPEVSGFAIRSLPDDEARTLRRVAFLRRVELAEEQFRGKGGIAAALEKDSPEGGPRASAASTAADPSGPEGSTSFVGVPSTLTTSLSRLSMGGQSDAGGGAAGGGAGGKGPTSFERLLYSPLDLGGLFRKRQQMALLAAVIRERQAQFNEQVEKVKVAKDAFISRVRDINSRIKDICRDIDIDLSAPGAEPLFEPQTAPGETEIDALTVKPEEIKAEKWLSLEERRVAEEKQRQEEARRREAEGDTPAARALKQMMGGVLRSAQDKREGAPEKPTFMDRVPKEQWTEEQQRAVKDYEAREKVYHEEREKKVKLLEAELKKLRLEIADAVTAFNASVAALAEERWTANGSVAELELQVCRLALDIEMTSRKGEAEEMGMCDALAAARRDHKEAVKAASYFRRQLDSTNEVFEVLSNEDKAHEKNFRREFAEIGMEFYEELSKLYKRRGPRPADADGAAAAKPPQKVASKRISMGRDPAMHLAKQKMKRASQYGRLSSIPTEQQGVNARFVEMETIPPEPRDAFGFVDVPKHVPVPVVSVHPILDQPEGLDQWIWNHFMEVRAEKIASEEKLAKQRTVLEEHQKYLAHLEEVAEKERVRVEQLEEQLAEARKTRARSVYDLEITLRLKQGQVELPTSSLGMGIDTSDAVLLHRSFVEALNAEVRRQGKARVDALTQIKDFKRDIYALQWENKRGDMEIEDLLENNRALQLLKLPKNYQQLLEQKPETAAADEVSALERRLAFSRKDHSRRLDEFNRRIQRVQQQTSQVRSGTEALRQDLAALEREVLDQRRIQERAGGDQKSAEEAAVTRRRMRAVVTRRQLVDIAKGQAADLTALREELHNLRLRTYPSFVDHNAGQPVRKALPDQREESLRSTAQNSRERSSLRSPSIQPGSGLPMSPGGGQLGPNWSSQGARKGISSSGEQKGGSRGGNQPQQRGGQR